MSDRLRRYLTGGAAARPDSLSGLDSGFADSLARMYDAAPEDVRGALLISSAYRSPEKQQQLYDQALQKYGSEKAARRWVAPPGRSNHNHGRAADIRFGNDAARTWAHANAANYGLNFPLSNEDWHIEPVGIRGGRAPLPAVAASAPAEGVYTAEQAVPPGAIIPQQAFAELNQLPSLDEISELASVSTALKQRQDRRKQEQDAEQRRRAALLSGPLMFG